ncbi:MAG: hypothetical protein AAF570_09455, partial [Bacteroidota bacterium]
MYRYEQWDETSMQVATIDSFRPDGTKALTRSQYPDGHVGYMMEYNAVGALRRYRAWHPKAGLVQLDTLKYDENGRVKERWSWVD